MNRYSVRYVHPIQPSDADVGHDVELEDGALSDRKRLGAALRALGVLIPGARVVSFRVEGAKVVVFPRVPVMTTYWHSIILEKKAVE